MVGGSVPPVARYPSTSDGAVAILCPLAEALGGCLAEHPIGLGDRAIGVDDPMTLGSFGTLLEGTATQAVGLCQVQQEGGTVPTDHTGALDQQVGDSLGVTQESSEAGGGDDGKHRSRGGGWWRSVPLACAYPTRSVGGVEGLGSKSGQCPRWHSVSGGGARRARLEVDPMAVAYGLAGAVATVGVCRATPLLDRLSLVSYHRKGGRCAPPRWGQPQSLHQ